MTSRYDAKNAARVCAENAERKVKPVRPLPDVPRHVKKWLCVVLESLTLGKSMFFGAKLLPGQTIEVMWYGKVPPNLPREIRYWKTVYRLTHRRMTMDDAGYSWHGRLEPRDGIGCGFGLKHSLHEGVLQGWGLAA